MNYDFAGMKYDAEPTHSHEKEEVRCYDKYKESYYDGKRFIVTVEKYWNVDYADGEEALENAEMDIYTYTFEKYKDPGYTTGEYTLIGCEF